MNQVLVAHDRDADKIPANIRDGVEIDGVMGNYQGTFGVVTQIQYLSNPGVIEHTGGNSAPAQYCGGHSQYILCILFTSSNTNMDIIAIDKTSTTLGLTELLANEAIFFYVFSIYLDGDTIHINRDNNGDPEHANFDLTTLTLSGRSAGYATTGTQMTNVPIVSGGLTYTFTTVRTDNSADLWTPKCLIS